MTKLYFVSDGKIVELNHENIQDAYIKTVYAWEKGDGIFDIDLPDAVCKRLNSMNAYQFKQALEFFEVYYDKSRIWMEDAFKFAFSEFTPCKLNGTLDELAKGILLADGLPQNMLEMVLESVDKAALIKEEQKRFFNASNLEVLEDHQNNVVWVYQKAR